MRSKKFAKLDASDLKEKIIIVMLSTSRIELTNNKITKFRINYLG